jgi:small nuclear ribonucleoprotein G
MTGGEDDPMVHLIDKYVNILTLEAEKKTGDEDEEQEDDELEIPKTLGDLVKALLRLQRNIRREVKEGIRPFETLATHGVGAVLAGISDVAENRPQTNQTTPRRHSSHHHHHHHHHLNNRYMDKKLKLKLNGNRGVIGILRGFDQFLNLVLDECVNDSTAEKTPLGMVVVRGASVLSMEALEHIAPVQRKSVM